ncbi:MAG TPA: cytochrome-c peroxidase [Bacteroidetes bacterium]|nr:cytochrome-c peroxidase [Bacteroidota bacterium]
MKKNTFQIATFFILTVIVFGCQKETPVIKEVVVPTLPETPYNYRAINGPVSDSYVQQINNEMATLGRVLFYDRHLSQNNSTSCGSCHLQQFAFADGKRFSDGLNGKKTTRNSMAISNMIMQTSFFWDSRATKLERQVMMPIENHIEMGVENLGVLPDKLANLEYYKELFKNSFGTEDITESRISRALAMFLKSMISVGSKFDQGAFQNHENLNLKEQLGLELFRGKAKCWTCHSTSIFTGWGVQNIGLDLVYDDKGWSSGRFKIPSLKNIALTAPYMHDGRFETLEEVVNHYNEGVKPHPSLSWRLRNSSGPQRLNLSDFEKSNLVAFLESLTDYEYITDPRYSNPF